MRILGRTPEVTFEGNLEGTSGRGIFGGIPGGVFDGIPGVIPEETLRVIL